MKKNTSQSSEKLSAYDRILATAHDLFYQEGIRATGIDLIIKESGVTKVTFYRQFPSKNALILAFLEHRHQRWMTWFNAAIQRFGNTPDALIPALEQWFKEEHFRGCAFINSVVELGGSLPEVTEISKRHKQEMSEVIERLLPKSSHAKADALALALAIDGAIIRAQFEQNAESALQSFGIVLEKVVGS